jgi:hypothetical protein
LKSLITKLYDKHDDVLFRIINFPLVCGNSPECITSNVLRSSYWICWQIWWETNTTKSTYEIKENTHKTKSTWATRTPPKTGAKTRCTRRDGHTIFANRFSMTTVEHLMWCFKLTFRNIDVVLSLNNLRFGDYLRRIYPKRTWIKGHHRPC